MLSLIFLCSLSHSFLSPLVVLCSGRLDFELKVGIMIEFHSFWVQNIRPWIRIPFFILALFVVYSILANLTTYRSIKAYYLDLPLDESPLTLPDLMFDAFPSYSRHTSLDSVLYRFLDARFVHNNNHILHIVCNS
jgi:hypothetical protein